MAQRKKTMGCSEVEDSTWPTATSIPIFYQGNWCGGRSRVAVHAAEDEVDTEVGDQHAQEGDDAVAVEEHGLAEHGQRLAVQRQGVDDERDECPHFLGIPAPVGTPRYIGPDGADKHARGQQEHGRVEDNLSDDVQALDNDLVAAQDEGHHSSQHEECQQ